MMKTNHTKKANKLAAAAAILLVSASLTGCTGENQEKELAYRKAGIEYMDNGSYAEAVAAFDKALSYCRGSVGEIELDICHYKAAAQYASGGIEGALATCDALTAYDAKDADAYYTRGCLLLQKGEKDKALEDFSKAIIYNADDYELYIHIYKNLSSHNMAEQGKEYLNQAFAIKGDDAAHLTYRGELYLLLGEYENAQKELTAAIEKESVRANLILAQLSETQGDMGAAETYYQAYVESGQVDAEALNALAEIEMEKGAYETALSYINQGLEAETVANKRELMQNQVICLEYMAEFASAWQVAEEYMALYPNDLEMQREYIFLKNRQLRVDEEQVVQAEVETEAETEVTEEADMSATEIME